jgi:hypothetical protein
MSQNIPPLLFAASLAPPGEDRAPRRFAGVAYQGGMIPNHWAWGNVVFDLAALEADAPAPLLVEHDRNQRAGIIDAFGVGPDGLTVSGRLLDTDTGRQIAAEADAGFPWQMSVHIEPARIEKIDGQTEINGRLFDGPLTVFRANVIREVSLTPTGADRHTRATIFTHTRQQEAPVADSPKQNHIDGGPELVAALHQRIAELQNENESLRAQFAAQVKADRVQQFAAATGKMADQVSAEHADALAGMTEVQFALVLGSAKPAAPAPDSRLFSEQATGGAPAPTKAAPSLVPTSQLYAARAAAARGDA